MAYSGSFIPENKGKYKGNFKNIKYRSSWELYMMRWLDNNKLIRKWNSEEVVIPYFSNADGKKRRYFMDFYVEFVGGEIYLFEVKPFKETMPPKAPSRLTTKAKKSFINEAYTHQVNKDKWKAAIEVCKKKGWTFKVITEKTLKSHFGWKG